MQPLLRDDVDFGSLYAALASRWPWLAASIVVGGLLALAVSWMLPASYRATASLGIGIDYGRSEPLNREAERLAFLQVQELVLSDDTLAQAMTELDPAILERNAIESPGDFRAVIWLDRYEGRWDLSARSERPAEAAALANAWLNASVTALERAVEHALRVQELQRSMYELGCALEESADGSQVLWGCVVGDPEEGDDLPEVLVDEIERSKGVIPGLTFAALRQANAPTEPLYRGRTWLLLGGLLAGLAVGLFLVVLGLGDSANGSGAQEAPGG